MRFWGIHWRRQFEAKSWEECKEEWETAIVQCLCMFGLVAEDSEVAKRAMEGRANKRRMVEQLVKGQPCNHSRINLR